MKRAKKKPARKRAAPKKRKVAKRRSPSRRRGLMLVLSSPSGAGKTTLTRMLLEDEKDNVELSVSVTTRPKRASEIEGRHYHFIDRKKFDDMASRGELLEWAEVHGNGYGTPRAPVEKFLRGGKDVLFDIDWQGTRQLYDAAPKDVVRVFVLPPTADELRSRLARRAEDNQEIIQQRLRNAIEELDHWGEYDYVIVNEDLDRSFRALKAILAAERMRRTSKRAPSGEIAVLSEKARRENQPNLGKLVRNLKSDLVSQN
jgi:guanylate kinase